MRHTKINLALTVLLVTGLGACGGGSGDGSETSPVSSSGTDNSTSTSGSGSGTNNTSGGTSGGTDLGISGSGAPIAMGTIDAFGSIFVNGVEFDTDEAEIIADGQRVTEDDLSVGMVVTVSGTINDDGITGTADAVIFDDDVQGPIEAIAIDDSGDSATITVLGLDIIIERGSTVFKNTTFDTLALGDVVEVSGFPEGISQLRATLIEKESDFIEGESDIELKGTVSNLTDSTFTLGNYTIDYSNADLTEVTNGTLTEGMFVEVEGTLSGVQILASEIETERRIDERFEDDDEFNLQGTIRDYESNSSFTINGVQVDASNAVFEPSFLSLADGLIVEVEGAWSNSVLFATEVKARRGKIEVEGAVGALSNEDQTVTIRLVNGTLLFKADNRTMYDDDTDRVTRFGFSDLSIGDFLEIEAYDDGTQLLATSIERDDRDDEVLQGPVDSFNQALDITVLGIQYSTQGARFESRNGQNVSASVFYADLKIGDFVKIKDKELADGIADEVEIDSEVDNDDD